MPRTGLATTSDGRVMPGALSPRTADLVRGPRRPALVLGASRHGVYLGLGRRVLPVLTSDAVDLPDAVRLAAPSGGCDLGVVAGDRAVVGAGAVRLPSLTVRGVRTWRPARVRPVDGDASPEVDALLGSAVAGAPDWLARGVAEAAAAADPAGAVARLVGRGAGLTPSGDDALAGCLLLLRAVAACPRDRADQLAAAVRARLATTTAVSAALLDAAADGWAGRDVVTLVDATARGDVDAVRAALPAVLAVGHTSGRDLVTGVRATADVLHRTGKVAA
ncbi:DUF2877 domain-containing protein [Phycicoccus sp. CSK15P-2]|uniref:oxamate carbamoyltransferase subunit AllH family protein n=1 Tax=Phycicoccus sp. CSK15P-2 TaxID=2807627 RepID=UPI00194F7095|nr:DUF2877 domain-containing protein [Phycicoccus sp. CSK15P-2]MBM6402858.1 DUF2877 domain-containing protein [Phycicoccus sp. CSK15P-2]